MAVREIVHVAQPIVEGGNRIIASPFQFAVDGTDNLRVSVANSLAGVVVTVDGRFLDENNKVLAFHYTFVPTSNRMPTSQIYALGKGFVLNLTCYASTGSPRIGQTFVKVDIVRGLSGAIIALGTMLQGYVTSNQALGWPGSPIVSSIEGGGYIRQITGTNPGPGAEISEIVPAGARWRLLTCRAILSTDGTVADRRPHLRFNNTGSPYFISANPATAPASSVINFYWAQSAWLDTAISALAGLAGLPDYAPLLVGDSIDTATANLAAGDDWFAPFFTVEEWLEVQ